MVMAHQMVRDMRYTWERRASCISRSAISYSIALAITSTHYYYQFLHLCRGAVDHFTLYGTRLYIVRLVCAQHQSKYSFGYWLVCVRKYYLLLGYKRGPTSGRSAAVQFVAN